VAEPTVRVVRGVLRWDDSNRPKDDARYRATGYGFDVEASGVWARSGDGMRWRAGDVALAAGVALVCQLDVWAPLPFVSSQSHRLVLSLVFLSCSIALLWRRQRPLTVLVFIFGICSVMYLLIGAPEALGTLLPQLVATYSAGRYSEPSSLIIAGPVVVLGTAWHELEDPQFQLNGPAIFFWALTAAAWPLGQAFRRRERAIRALSRHAEELRRTQDNEARAAVAAERARIARELHDVVGHGVSVVVLQLVAALGMLDKGEVGDARRRLLATERSAREALAEMRRLLGLLDENEDASLAPQPRLADLDHLVTQTRAAGVSVDLTVTGEPVELPAGLELAVYRVAQEALTNVIKHARPASARVLLTYGSDDVLIEVVDDGDTQVVSLDGGRGIAGMRERVALYAGDLTVQQNGMGGLLVRARFPTEQT
jgi:signal transduction histidine kinase